MPLPLCLKPSLLPLLSCVDVTSSRSPSGIPSSGYFPLSPLITRCSDCVSISTTKTEFLDTRDCNILLHVPKPGAVTGVGGRRQVRGSG